MAEHTGGRAARAAARSVAPGLAWDALWRAVQAGDDDEAEAAALSIAAHGPEQWPQVQAWLQAPDPDRRWWAVRILAAWPAPLPQAAAQALVRALHDPAEEVQQAAALALRQHPQLAAREPLLALLETGAPLTASLAADALAALGADAVLPLVHILQTGSPQARREAARALAGLQDARAIPALFAALDDPSPHVTAWAEEALQRMGVGMMFWTF